MLFYLKHRKVIICLACFLALVMVIVLWKLYKGSGFYIDSEIKRSQRAIQEVFSEEKAHLEELVHEMLSASNEANVDLRYSSKSERLSSRAEDVQGCSELKKMLQEFDGNSKGLFDAIYTVKDGNYAYPENSCVFECTLWVYNDIYCWVDLVFSESEAIENRVLEAPFSEKLEPGWYIAVRYGY